MIKTILRTIKDFRPDFVLSVNHSGFDREGNLSELLTCLKTPFASWYVDSPRPIISQYPNEIISSAFYVIFLWDKDYIQDLRSLGFDKVHFLPLATDPAIFRPLDVNPDYKNEVAFVGNSMVNKIRSRLKKLGIGPENQKDIEAIGTAFAKSGCRNVADILNQEPYQSHPLVRRMNNANPADFETLIIWQSTLLHRLEYIKMLTSFQTVIRGDSGWRSLLKEGFQIGPELSYYDELNCFYNSTRINLNITSTQMRNAVNQRVFDVPAAGGFLLTDYKEQLEEMLDVGKDIICYQDKEEIPDYIRFYLSHNCLREKIIQRGKSRILKEHTYTHRLKELCGYMRIHFKN